jgi:hypothetical protein
MRQSYCVRHVLTELVASMLRAVSRLLWETMEDALEDASQRPGTCTLIPGNSIHR